MISRTICALAGTLARVSLLLACAITPVRAQSLPPISYTAPGGCPTRADLERALRARLAEDAPRALVECGMLRVRIERAGARTAGALSLESEAHVTARRRIVADSCAEAVDALAFIAALWIERLARGTPLVETQAEPPPRPHRAREPRVASTPARTNLPATSSTAEAPESAVASEPPPEPGPAPEPEPSESPPPEPERLEARPPRAESERPAPVRKVRPRAPRDLAGELLASALLASGMAPTPQLGLALSGSLGTATRSRPGAVLRAGARAALPHTEQSAQGDSTFRWWSGMAALCGATREHGPRMAIAACFIAEVGRLYGEGANTEAPKRVARTWSALGPGLRASFRPFGALLIVPSAELLVPLFRDRFVLGDTSVHLVPSLTFRAEIAMGVQFR